MPLDSVSVEVVEDGQALVAGLGLVADERPGVLAAGVALGAAVLPHELVTVKEDS